LMYKAKKRKHHSKKNDKSLFLFDNKMRFLVYKAEKTGYNRSIK